MTSHSSIWNTLHYQWKSHRKVSIPGKTRCVLLHYDSSKHCICPLNKFIWAFKVVKLILKLPSHLEASFLCGHFPKGFLTSLPCLNWRESAFLIAAEYFKHHREPHRTLCRLKILSALFKMRVVAFDVSIERQWLCCAAVTVLWCNAELFCGTSGRWRTLVVDEWNYVIAG
jgi:hypothetical protein